MLISSKTTWKISDFVGHPTKVFMGYLTRREVIALGLLLGIRRNVYGVRKVQLTNEALLMNVLKS